MTVVASLLNGSLTITSGGGNDDILVSKSNIRGSVAVNAVVATTISRSPRPR